MGWLGQGLPLINGVLYTLGGVGRERRAGEEGGGGWRSSEERRENVVEDGVAGMEREERKREAGVE